MNDRMTVFMWACNELLAKKDTKMLSNYYSKLIDALGTFKKK